MKYTRTLSFLFASLLGVSCTATPDGGDLSVDAANADRGDAANAEPADAAEPRYIPTWSLQDIQPMSPRFTETYGLDVFSGSVLVVVLVQGF